MNSTTRLQTLLIDSPVGAVLPAIALLNLPNWWLAGGEEVELALCKALPSTHISTHLEPLNDPVSWEDQELERNCG